MFFRVLMLFAAIALTLSAYGQMTPKNADDHFQMGNFEQALKIYEHLYKRDSTNTEYTHRVGVCHLNLTYDRAKAIPFLEKASTMKGVSNFIWFDLGSAYRYTGQFDKAKENLEKFIGITRNSYDKAQAELMLKQIENAKALMAKPVNVKFINLGANINSEFDDFYPYVDINNRWMIYNSRRIFSKLEEALIVNVHNAVFKQNQWKRAMRSKSVNSAESNYIVGKSANDDFIFIKPYRYEVYEDIMMIDVTKGNIGARPLILPAPVNTNYEESGATLSPTGDTLIFASDRKGGVGELDLYMSIKLPDNSWGTPVNIGNQINTPYNEDYPMFSSDGKSLYFASQGHTSMGGYDIFVSKLNQSDGTWGTPRNLGYPINNLYDNYTICYTQNSRYAYVADVRPEGLGGYDIYQLVFKNEEKSIHLLKGIMSKGSVSSKQQLTEADSVQISIYNEQANELVGKYKIDYSSGRFIAAIFPGTYVLKVESATCKTLNHKFTIPDMLADEEFDLGELFLEAISN